MHVIDLGKVPVLGGLGDGVGDVGAGGAEQHDLVRTVVHHVEERLHSDRCITLQHVRTNKVSSVLLKELFIPHTSSFTCHR